MKDTFKKPYIAVLGASFLIALAATVVRTILLLTDYDASLGHFAESPIANLLFPLLLIIATVFYAAFGIIARNELGKKDLDRPLPIVFASAFAAVATLVWFITQIPRLISAESIALPFAVLTLLFSLGLFACFLTTALSVQNKTLNVLAGTCAVLFCVFYILYSYFDTSFVLNSPIKIFDQLTFLVFVLFFLAECRFSFGIISYAAYLPITLLCATFAMANAIPALIYAAIEQKALTGNVMHDFLTFAVFVYALTRSISVFIVEKAVSDADTYQEEIAAESQKNRVPDRDTHIILGDPDQEEFDFDTPATESETKDDTQS